MALKEVGRRTIGDFGILKLDEINDSLMGTVSAWTQVQIWLVLRRIDENSYKNLEWNPDQSMYARCTVAASDDLGFTNPPILMETVMKYQMQLIYEWRNDAALTNFLIQCGTQKILNSILNLGTALGLAPFLISELPECKREICPASVVRVNCDRGHIIDIVVLAENDFALLEPQEDICANYIPIPESDDVPRPGNSDNSLTPASDVPDENALPDPPYDPPSGDEGETPQAPPVEPLPGQMARVRFSGTIALCNQREPFPYNAVSITFPAPITVDVYVGGNCQSPPIIPFQNIRVTYNGNETYDVLTVLTKLPDSYVIEYFYP